MRNRTFIFMLLIVSLGSSLAELQSQTSVPSESAQTTSTQPPIFNLLDPSGPFGIGRVGYEWIDNARSDRYSSAPGTHRDLMVYLWYPTPPRAAGVAENYWPGAKQMDANPDVHHNMTEEFGTLWPLIVSGSFKSHAIESAPVAKAPKQFPIVLFSHGLGSTSFEYTSLIEDLVSHGYIIAAIEHTYTAAAVVFPDGRVIPAHHDSEPAGLSPEQRFKRMMDSAALEIRQGAEDLIFVQNKLTELNKSQAQNFPLAGKLDLNRTAAVGHSAGGAFATGACQLDARFHACLSLDGEMPPAMAFPEFPETKGFHQPVLLLEVDHTGERMPFSPAQYSEFLEKEKAQLSLCPKGSYDILLKSPGLFHGSFSDYPLRAANGDATKVESATHNLRLTQSFTIAFLDKYLKDQREPLLDEPSQSPEAVITPYGHKGNISSGN